MICYPLCDSFISVYAISMTFCLLKWGYCFLRKGLQFLHSKSNVEVGLNIVESKQIVDMLTSLSLHRRLWPAGISPWICSFSRRVNLMSFCFSSPQRHVFFFLSKPYIFPTCNLTLQILILNLKM